ncbi:MAG: sel1 repeat family protein [Rhodospirillaceae bacterium]|nr:sel1 repeat family protein [Rhodospirillaceae bacterium]
MILLFALPVSAATLEEGQEAFFIGDSKKAVKILRPLAEAGNAVASFSLGTTYAYALDSFHNRKEAIKWLRLAAARGHTDALTTLGSMYHNKYGGSHDVKTAYDFYQRAANKGDDRAFVELGEMYLNGDGRAVDYARAREYFILASDFGNTWGEYYLALMFHKGFGTAPDYKMAHALYLTDARAESEAAAEGIAELYESGLIPSKTPAVEGTAWRIAGLLFMSYCLDEEILEHLSILPSKQNRRMAGERAHTLLAQLLEDRLFKNVSVDHFLSFYVDQKNHSFLKSIAQGNKFVSPPLPNNIHPSWRLCSRDRVPAFGAWI